VAATLATGIFEIQQLFAALAFEKTHGGNSLGATQTPITALVASFTAWLVKTSRKTSASF
jgi:hypothetical protein